MNEQKIEYAIWGITPEDYDKHKNGKMPIEFYEQLLFTEINDKEELPELIEFCKNKGAKNIRVQTLDFSTPPDFTKTLNI